mgnify:CR=1 FL=1
MISVFLPEASAPANAPKGPSARVEPAADAESETPGERFADFLPQDAETPAAESAPRQVDLDGNYDFSELQTWVLNGTSAGLIVYPNPASSEVLVEGLIEHIRVFDLNGRLCIEQAPSRDGPTRLDVSYLPAGIYALQAGSKTSRIVIDR